MDSSSHIIAPRPSGALALRLGVAALLTLTAALMGACEPLGDISNAGGATCGASDGTVVVDGDWVISGKGNRYSCGDDTLDGNYTLGPSIAIRVRQDAISGNPDAYNLSLDKPITGFQLSGTARGNCVDFETTETWNGDVIVRRFTGRIDSSGDLTGTFSGDGPSACDTDGTFTVEID